MRRLLAERLEAAMRSLKGQRKQEAKEEAEAAKAEARQLAEEEALAEARERAAKDEQDWLAFEDVLFAGWGLPPVERGEAAAAEGGELARHTRHLRKLLV